MKAHKFAATAVFLLLVLASCARPGTTLAEPEIISVTPGAGPIIGGTPVTISGSGFFQVQAGRFPHTLAVSVCGAPLQNVQVHGSSRQFVLPGGASVSVLYGDTITGVTATAAEPDGDGDVTVHLPDGQTTTLPAAFNCFSPQPEVTSFTATPASVVIGQPVTISWSIDNPAGTELSCTLDSGEGLVEISDCQSGTAVHAYAAAGTYRPLLTVDAGGEEPVSARTLVEVTEQLPVATADTYLARNSEPLIVPAPGVLANDELSGAELSGPTQTQQGGALTLNADGSFTYDAPESFTGRDSFTYRLVNASGSSEAEVTIEVASLPVAQADHYVTTRDTELNVPAADGVLTNDSGVPAPTVTAWEQLEQGTLVGHADGSFSYTPAAGFTGTVSFGYTITNPAGSANATVVIDINESPVATDDSYSTGLDEALSVAAPGLLANDTGVPAPQAVEESKTSANGGTVQIFADGSFLYVPAAGFTGTDSFSYRVSNVAGSDTAEAVITVGSVPVAFGDDGNAVYETALDIAVNDLLANDTVNGAVLSLPQVLSSEGGTVALAGGTVTYTPPTGFVGADSFSYTLANGLGESAASVTITVKRAPVPQDDQFVAVVGVTLNVAAPGVLANDAGYPTPVVAARTGVVTSLGGRVSIHADGSFDYQPPSVAGADSFTYLATNELGAQPAAVSIEVRATPVAVADSYTVSVGAPLVVTAPGVLANDLGSPAPAVTPVTLTGSSGSSLQLSADGSFVFTPAAGFIGLEDFEYGISNSAGSATGQLEFTVGEAPEGRADSYSTTVNTQLAVAAAGVLTNDTVNGAVLVPFAAAETSAGGKVDLLIDGSFTYQPPLGFAGSDSFEYELKNGLGTETVTVTISVGWAGAPVAVDDLYATPSGVTLEVAAPGVRENDTHHEAPVVSSAAVSIAGGTVTVQPDGAFTYVPPADYSGRDLFTYTIENGLGESPATVFIDVTSVGRAVADHLDTPIATAVSGNVLANDLGWPRPQVTLWATPTHGQLTVGDDGAFTFTPDANFVGVASFLYEITGHEEERATGAEVTIKVGEAPTAVDDNFAAEASNIPALFPSVLTNDSRQLASFATDVLSGDAGGSLTLQPDGQFSYSPVADHQGLETFSYELTNAHGSSQADISIFLYEQVVAVADNVSVAYEEAVTIEPLENDSGWPEPSLFSIGTTGLRGSAEANVEAGSVTYTAPAGFVGTDTFTYTAGNGYGDTATATVTVTVGAVPVAADDTFLLLPSAPELAIDSSGLLLNDSYVGQPDISIDTAGLLGTLTATPSGWSYARPADFAGPDSFTYTLSNDLGHSTATVTVGVAATVVATPDNYVAIPGRELSVSAADGVLANDTGYPLPTATLLSEQQTGGNLVLAADGSFTFTPAAGFIGEVSYRYSATNVVNAAEATLHIVVGSPPEANPDDAGTVPGNVPGLLYTGSTAFNPLANDVGDSLRLVSVDNSESVGTATLLEDGTIHYAAPAGYTGPDSFGYTVESHSMPATGTVTLNVAGMIWFVDAAAEEAGSGRLDSPFTANDQLPELNSGEVVFFYSGAYTGAPALQPGVRLIGQGATGNFADLAGISWPAGTLMPRLLGPDDGQVTIALGSGSLALNSDNHLHGLSISGTAAADPLLHGSNFGSLTASSLDLQASGRDALQLVDGAVNAQFAAVSSAGGASPVSLEQLSGNLRIMSGSLATSGNASLVERCVRVQLNGLFRLHLTLQQLAMEGCELGLDVFTGIRAAVHLDLQQLDMSTRGGGMNLYSRGESQVDVRLTGSALRTTTVDNAAVGFWAVAEEISQIRAHIQNTQVTGSSISVYVIAREGYSAHVDLTLTDSVLAAGGTWAVNGLRALAGNGPAEDRVSVCLDARGNTISTSAPEPAIALEQRANNNLWTAEFPGYGATELQDFLAARNGGATVAVTADAPNMLPGGPCRTPFIPGG